MAPPILPTPTCIVALLALAGITATALLLGVAPATVTGAAGLAAAGLALAALADLGLSRRAWRAAPLRWQRELPPALAVGVERTLGGSLVNEGERRWRVTLFEHVDAGFAVSGLPAEGIAPQRASLALQYKARPGRRGTAVFAPAELRVRTLGGLFEMRFRVGGAATLRVYPNFAAVAGYAWLAGDRRLSEIGIKSYPQRGSGTDFKQLADYRPGDAIRDIDWKATLRHGKPIVREYQDERDQRVVFLLDCGRRMRADEGTAARHGSHFDAALDALMLLAYVALKEGDEVGAMTFGGGAAESRSFAPRKGVRSLNALIATLYDIEPQPTHPDYRAAATAFMETQAKRSLVVLLTNFREDDAGELGPALALLRTRHLVLVASLRERALREIAEQPLRQERDAIEVAGAHLFGQARDDAFRKLAGRDALLLDVEPQRLAIELVNRYRAVKRAGLL
ncbi:MAG: DUF58 domain-containing protein [Caldimonas sp.]